jgi:hypothetical protein
MTGRQTNDKCPSNLIWYSKELCERCKNNLEHERCKTIYCYKMTGRQNYEAIVTDPNCNHEYLLRSLISNRVYCPTCKRIVGYGR